MVDLVFDLGIVSYILGYTDKCLVFDFLWVVLVGYMGRYHLVYCEGRRHSQGKPKSQFVLWDRPVQDGWGLN